MRLFLTLFYRERLARLAQYLILQEGAGNDPRFRDLKLSAGQIADLLYGFIRAAEAPDRCLDDCKSLYFCEKRARHRGRHKEGTISW